MLASFGERDARPQQLARISPAIADVSTYALVSIVGAPVSGGKNLVPNSMWQENVEEGRSLHHRLDDLIMSAPSEDTYVIRGSRRPNL
jgi:hypothetical protein